MNCNMSELEKFINQEIKYAQHGYDKARSTELANIYYTRIETYRLVLAKINELSEQYSADVGRIEQ